ncbi:MAG: hypothetical protein U0903_13330 [Planctomycetales bacterium]
MARHEADREDLLEEARALVPRVEILSPEWSMPIVLGRRRDDFLSLYLGQDRVYHFDAEGGLRRAYVDGFLYRSAGSTLTRIRRTRTEEETTLLTQDLTSEELSDFLIGMRSDVQRLSSSLEKQDYEVLRQVPESGDPLPLLVPLVTQVLQARAPLSPALK